MNPDYRWYQFWRRYWYYELKVDYTLTFWHDGEVYRVTIPAGFRTDGASYSRFWFGTDGLHRRAVFWHDLSHRYGGDIPGMETQAEGIGWVKSDYTFSRNSTNQIFRQMMHDDLLPPVSWIVPYAVVQAIDWLFWKGKK